MKASIIIPPSLIADHFVTIIESPPMQWIESIYLEKCQPHSDSSEVWYADPAIYNEDLVIGVTYDDPDDEEGSYKGEKIITYADIQAGYELLLKQRPLVFGRLLDEDGAAWDANDADTLAQFIILGEEIYG